MRKIWITLVIILVWTVPAFATITVDNSWEMKTRQNEIATLVTIDQEQLDFSLGVRVAGRMARPDDFELRVKQFGVSFKTDKMTFSGGLLQQNISKARINQTFLSESSPAFPNVGYALNGDNWNYIKILGDLTTSERTVDSSDNFQKRVGIHYLNWQLHPNLSLGIGEAFLTDGLFPGDIFYNTVPFIPFYLAKYMPGISSTADNSLIYGDGELILPVATLYGELLVNEFPMTPGAGNPKLYAITLGAESDQLLDPWDVIAEISFVSDHAYSNGNIDTVFSLGDLSLGHPLGDDIKSVDLQFKRFWEGINTETRFGIFAQELGNTEVKPWRNEAETKTPEQVCGLRLGASNWNNQIELTADLNIGYANNFQHQVDNTGWKYSARVGVGWKLP